MAPPSSWQPTQRGAKRLPPVQVYASSSDSEEYGNCMSHTGKKETKRQRSIWSDDDFDKNDDELYLHIQNGQGIDDAVPSRPRRKKQKSSDQPQRGLRHSHLWRSEFPPWLRKVDSNAMVCPNEELEHMATYLSVKPQEVQARRAIVRDISATIQAAFHQSHDLQFHLFGSLATATSSLATFRSDIDLTIQVVVPPSSANMVEYTSAAYDDDEGVGYPDSTGADQSYFDDHDADVDISGMQFNFITSSSSSHAPNSTPPSASASATNQRASSIATAAALNNKPAATSMSKAERSQCVRFLHKAARSLRQAHPSFQVEVRRLAKVPIINVVDPTSKIEVDVSLGMENPTPGDRIVAWYAANHPTFNILVVLLKEFLYQNAINKPYEGGIGSFRLYCMVTHVLATTPRKERGAPAALLLRFFQHFGCSQKFNNRTVLKLDLPHHDPPLRCEVEFQSIFRIRDCNMLFGEASKRLQDGMNARPPLSVAMQKQPKQQNEADKAATSSKGGVLASLFWTRDLRQERERRLALAAQSTSKGIPGLNGGIQLTKMEEGATVAVNESAKKIKPRHRPPPLILDKRHGKKRITTSTKKLKQARRVRMALGQ